MSTYRRTSDDFRRKQAAIDQIVATCNGDMRGALKALLMVNEQLEAELAQFYAAVAASSGMARGSKRCAFGSSRAEYRWLVRGPAAGAIS